MLATSLIMALAAAVPSGGIPLTVPTTVRERVLEGGRSDTFVVRLQRGGRLEATFEQRGIDLVIHVLDPSGREVTVVDGPNGGDGPEQVEFTSAVSGVFKVVVTPLEAKAPSGRYALTAVRVLSPAAERARLAALMQKRTEVRGWLAARAVVLGDYGSAVAANLAPALKGVDIVGLGEGSHGSHELFDIRARLVRLLVETQDFRVLAMELDRVACEQLDDYVHGRTSEVDPRLKPWDTEEVIALLNWLRDWNRRASPADQVSVIGIDGQDRVSGADRLIAYLRRAAPDRADAVATLTANTTFPLKLDDETARRTQQGYVDLLAFFELHATGLIARSSKAEYEAIRDLVHVMTQTGSIYVKGGGAAQNGRRDEYMADNLRRYLDRTAAGTKVIVWAHNGHIVTPPRSSPPSGTYLRRLYGQRYYALGSTFLDGEYQAWTSGSPTFALGVYRAPDLPPSAIEHDLASVGSGPFFVDLRAGPRSPAISQWLGTAHPTRVIGGMYNPVYERYATGQVVLAEEADGYLFVQHSTRARPTPRMRAKYGEIPVTERASGTSERR